MKPTLSNLALMSFLAGSSFLIPNVLDNQDSTALAQKTEPTIIEENSDKAQDFKEKFEVYKEEILKDILTSYPELNLKDYTKIEATSSHDGLPSLLQVGKKNTEVESLINICWEKDDLVLGEKWLFVKENKGYFLYKTPDGSNVIRQIERDNETWKVKKETIKEGRKINWTE